ncbi:uncharacterized protein V6R79_014602 [Siganus canaliculatus]
MRCSPGVRFRCKFVVFTLPIRRREREKKQHTAIPFERAIDSSAHQGQLPVHPTDGAVALQLWHAWLASEGGGEAADVNGELLLLEHPQMIEFADKSTLTV